MGVLHFGVRMPHILGRAPRSAARDDAARGSMLDTVLRPAFGPRERIVEAQTGPRRSLSQARTVRRVEVGAGAIREPRARARPRVTSTISKAHACSPRELTLTSLRVLEPYMFYPPVLPPPILKPLSAPLSPARYLARHYAIAIARRCTRAASTRARPCVALSSQMRRARSA